MEKEIREYNGRKLNSIDDFVENSIKGPQYVDIQNYRLSVYELDKLIKEYKYEEIINNFSPVKKVLTLYCVEGWDVDILWEGVLVKDILNDSKVNLDYKVIIFYGVDGYSTSLPLNFVLEKGLFLAYKMNGITLPPERGFPFQLVALDKWGYKWIKWITEIEVSTDEDYRGYWEEKGFSNLLDLDKDFIENPR